MTCGELLPEASIFFNLPSDAKARNRLSARPETRTGDALGSAQLLRRFIADPTNPQISLSFSRLRNKRRSVARRARTECPANQSWQRKLKPHSRRIYRRAAEIQNSRDQGDAE